jgi:cell wall-associated NlpC family hydrolase
MWTSNYLRLGFLMGGRERPAVDCWGLYRLIVGERLGTWLDEFGGVESPIAIARTMATTDGPNWVRLQPGEDRPFDLVMMRGVVGEGRAARSAGLHVGCVIEPGKMIDIEETTGVMIRAYRNTSRFSAMPTVINRVTGLFRPAVLA